jgi:hypothetical protein
MRRDRPHYLSVYQDSADLHERITRNPNFVKLLLEIDARRGRLRQSLRDTLRLAIQDGRLAAGTVLPASRRLAAGLGVSRGVASDAYDQLISGGYLEVEPRSAPVVAAVAAPTPPAPILTVPRWRFDFTETTPDVALFPRRVWLRAVQRAPGTTITLCHVRWFAATGRDPPTWAAIFCGHRRGAERTELDDRRSRG